MNGKAAVVCVFMVSGVSWAAGDPARGEAMFQACAACHSTKAGTHLTGPSLASIWGHKAGTVPGFARYSDAMKHANIVWGAATLDRWLANPDGLLPGTSMTFPGLKDSAGRQDVIAYLKAVSGGTAPATAQRGGMMGQPTKEDLKKAPPQGQVAAISHCRDSYAIKTGDGKVNKVWEFNLRFKTDSSELGPRGGKPVIVGSGMQGDRASIVFATPGEMSGFIKELCE